MITAAFLLGFVGGYVGMTCLLKSRAYHRRIAAYAQNAEFYLSEPRP